jgi:hypothetical protein
LKEYTRVAGTYTAEEDVYIVLGRDGAFSDHDHDAVTAGRYSIYGSDLTLKYDGATGKPAEKLDFRWHAGSIVRPPASPGGVQTVYLKSI